MRRRVGSASVTNALHSAAGSAAGYLHQIQKGLVLLWRRTASEPNSAIALEGIDDLVVSEGDDVTESVQVKHSVRHADLTDRAEPLWKTLAVWMDTLAHGGLDARPRLTLLTTTRCAPDSAVAGLRPEPEHRNERAAEEKLVAAAAERPGNNRTLLARQRFTALATEDRATLIAAIDIVDGDARVEDFQAELREIVGLAAPDPESVTTMTAALFAWWMERAASMLAGRLDRVTGRELWAQVSEQHALISRARLVADIDILSADPDQSEHVSLLKYVFVRQVELVTDGRLMLELAVKDFWRARQQRSHWSRTGRLTREELEEYDRRLEQEWQAAWAMMHARLGDEPDDEARRAAGLRLLSELQRESRARLPTDFQEPIITRGSLHLLADEPAIGWHPDYVKGLGG